MPPTTGRWGRIIAVTRLATGLILFFYVLTHNLNHALGLISLSAMEAGRTVFLGFWRPLELVLLLAALLHLSIGLRALYRRKSLRMPFLEAAQLTLGLRAPPLLLLHILGTSVAHALYGVDDRYAYVLWVIWTVSPGLGVMQSLALVVTWIHGCIGLNYWLRVKPWFPPWRPFLGALALLIPVLSLLGFVAGAREVARLAAGSRLDARRSTRRSTWPSPDEVAFLYRAARLADAGVLRHRRRRVRGARRAHPGDAAARHRGHLSRRQARGHPARHHPAGSQPHRRHPARLGVRRAQPLLHLPGARDRRGRGAAAAAGGGGSAC